MMQRKRKRIPIEKIVLGSVAAAGVIAAVAIAPGIGPALKMFGAERKRYPSRYLNSALARLNSKGYIKFERRRGKTVVRLTTKGQERLHRYQRGGSVIEPPQTWDRKWRIVIFDIEERRRNVRDKLRKELVTAGFMRLQRSVWIYPHDCEEFIALLKADYRIGKDILYVVAEKVEYDRRFKERFEIKG